MYEYNGRTLTVTDNRGTTTTAYEDGNDRVHSVTEPVTGTISYTYGVGRERATMSLPGGGTWHYTYWWSQVDLDGFHYPSSYCGTHLCYPVDASDDPDKLTPLLQSMTDDQGREVDFSIDILGAVESVTFNKAYAQWGNMASYCNTFMQMDEVPTDNGTGSMMSHRWIAEQKSTWNYVDQYQQWHSRIISQNSYTLDNVGNRLTNTISTQPLNTDGTPQFNTDGTPVLTSRTEQYGYDELNRLTGVNYGDGGSQQYSFDNMGNRAVLQDSAAGTTNSTYNAANILLTA